MPNISKKTAYDVKQASNQSLSKGARKHYAENAQAGSKADSPMNMGGSKSPMYMGGSFMSKHSQSGFQQSSPLHQGKAAEEGVMASRESNIKHHQGIYNAFDQKAKGFKPDSQSQADGINSRYSNLAANVNTRIHRANKSADSINAVRKGRKSVNSKSFDDLMK